MMDSLLAEYLTDDEEVALAITHISNVFQEGSLFVEDSDRGLIPCHEEEAKVRNGFFKMQQGFLKHSEFIHIDNNRYYLTKAWKLEQEVQFHFERLVNSNLTIKIDEQRATLLVEELQRAGKVFEDQKNAMLEALLNPVFCIWGGPGTGKSYTARCFLEVFLQVISPQNIRVVLAAPTGKASRLLARGISCIECDVKTLHALLEIRPSGKILKKNAPLAYDLFIIDESSMVDAVLCKKLLERTAEGSRILFLGDPCQLPPIEPGMPFASFVKRQGNKGKLTSCRRTERASIPALAHAVNESSISRVFEILKSNADTLSLLPLDDCTLSCFIEEYVKQLYSTSSPPQMLSALRVGKFGIIEINERMLVASERYAARNKKVFF